MSLVSFRVQLAKMTAGPIPKVCGDQQMVWSAAGAGLHTCGVTGGPISHQGHDVAGLRLNDAGERLLSRAVFGDDCRGYSPSGNFYDIIRVVRGVKLP